MTTLEVWGDPISHSRSPHLHMAAYRALGLDWQYGRRQVCGSAFDGELAGLDASFRGLSLTMPLKELAYERATTRDSWAMQTGAVNTLLLAPDGPQGFNTDIGGFLGALRENGITGVDSARIVGAGATASSALVALAEIGARHVEVVARSAERAQSLLNQAAARGLTTRFVPFDSLHALTPVAATIATLPGGTQIAERAAAVLAENGGALLDAVYDPWPTQLGDAFARIGAPVASGRHMLLHQAVLQVRIFVSGDPTVPLDSEDTVVAAMRHALMGD